MRDSKSSKLMWVVILAAVVAALTTLSVFCLRARVKKKRKCSFSDSIDYDFDDCCCEDCTDENGENEDDFADEQPVQIPRVKPDDEPNTSEE